MTKRLVDIVGAIVGLLVSLPLLAAIAIAVRLDSRGPALFTPVRIGRGGRPFRLYKFRSMFVDADKGSAITAGVDPRVTRVGRLLRPLRLDELPQLFNVLKGDMSLVGPRPEAPSIVERYTPEQREVLDVRPGITGPTQLTSLDEAARLPGVDATEFYLKNLLPQKIQYDLHYVRTRTLLQDLQILLMTPIRLGQFALAGPSFARPLKITRLVSDLVLVSLAAYVAYLARFDGNLPAGELRVLLLGLPFVVTSYAFAFLFRGTFRSIWRYASVADFWQVAKACAIGGTVNAVGMYLMSWPYPRSVQVLTPAFAVLLLGGARLTWRTSATALVAGTSIAQRRRVVIVGAGRAGASVAGCRRRPCAFSIRSGASRVSGARLHCSTWPTGTRSCWSPPPGVGRRRRPGTTTCARWTPPRSRSSAAARR